MPVLIDSDILIEVTRGRNAPVLQLWAALAGSNEILMCSPVTVAELWHGVKAGEQDALAELFDALEVTTIDREVGRVAGENLKGYSKSQGVELGDALIGAEAILRKSHLWTRNRKHYPMSSIRFFEG